MGVSEHHCKLVLAVSQASKAFHCSHWLTNGQLQAFWFSFRFMCSFDINLIKPNLVLKQDEIKVICLKLKNCERYRKQNYALKKKIRFCKILSISVSLWLKVSQKKKKIPLCIIKNNVYPGLDEGLGPIFSVVKPFKQFLYFLSFSHFR